MNKNHDNVSDLKTAVTCKSYLKSCEKRRLNFNDEQNYMTGILINRYKRAVLRFLNLQIIQVILGSDQRMSCFKLPNWL